MKSNVIESPNASFYKTDVAVIMSVYSRDEPKYLKLALNSIINQSHKCDVFLCVDGAISPSLNDIIELYSNEIIVFRQDNNYGLAYCMNFLIDNIGLENYKYVARFDADDISCPHRIAKQVSFLDANKDIGVVGTDCIEINEFGSPIYYKSMAKNHVDLASQIIRKCPFNHPTVMFRSSIFTDDHIRYNSSLLNTQDYYLWVELLAKGYKFSNINEPLLKFRVTKDFYKKRGFSKAKNDFYGRVFAMKKLHIYTAKNLALSVMIFLLRVSPSFISSFAYKFLR